jgi:hypothetical protein
MSLPDSTIRGGKRCSFGGEDGVAADWPEVVSLGVVLLHAPRALIGVSGGGVVEEASIGLDVLTIFVADDFPSFTSCWQFC